MKTIHLDSVGEVAIKKSARAKRVILKIRSDGVPEVVLPRFAPYVVGERFARSNIDWIVEHASQSKVPHITDGFSVGQDHKVKFVTDSTILKPRSRVQSGTVTIHVPVGTSADDPTVQKEALKALTRAVKKSAEAHLPSRLYLLANTYDYKYTSVSVKNMRSRWGSCSSQGVIALNIWLMQVPDRLKDYVLCHELAHLNNPHHQTAFWAELEQMIPDYKTRRRELKQYHPSL